GAVHVRARALDIALGAVRIDDGTVRFDVRLGDALPLEYADGERLWSCQPDEALTVIAAVGDACRPLGRARSRVDAWGRARSWEEVVAQSRGALARTTGPATPQPWTGSSVAPVGVHRQRQPALVAVGAVARLGRVDPAVLRAVAECGRGHALRLS